MKKLTALILALTMLLSLGITASASSSDDFSIVDGYLYKYYGPGGDVVIPDGVTVIYDYAFEYCDSLTSVTIPEGVTSIGDSAFYHCTSLTSVTIPSTVTSIGDWAFDACSALTSVTIPNSVTSIGYAAFNDCTSLTNVTIPGSVTSIDEFAFEDCTGLTSVTIQNGVASIGNRAFIRCAGLTSVTIPSTVTSIGEYTFEACTSLTSVTIPNSVTSIGEGAFYGCTRLTSVTIPSSVTFIDEWAFDGSSSLADVYYDGSEAQWSAISIEASNDPLLNATIHYNSATPEPPAQTEPPVETVGQFADVPAGEYYAVPVAWAVEKKITTGMTDTTFGPDVTCSTAHILTFLYRAAGSPEVAAPGSVAGVPESEYYYSAVNWAYEQGMIGADGFGPDVPCTRASTVMFLWQAAGSPEVALTTQFTDVPADSDYAMAVAWALENGVTTGKTDTTFGPDDICTRGQIVTFLWRAFAD